MREVNKGVPVIITIPNSVAEARKKNRYAMDCVRKTDFAVETEFRGEVLFCDTQLGVWGNRRLFMIGSCRFFFGFIFGSGGGILTELFEDVIEFLFRVAIKTNPNNLLSAHLVW